MGLMDWEAVWNGLQSHSYPQLTVLILVLLPSLVALRYFAGRSDESQVPSYSVEQATPGRQTSPGHVLQETRLKVLLFVSRSAV